MSKKWKRVPGYPYVYERGSTYSVRVQVPRDVRGQIGKGELKRSLGGDFSVVKRKHHGVVAEFVAAIEAARSHSVAPSSAASVVVAPTDEEIEVACYAHFRRMVDNMRGRVAHPVGDAPRSRLNRVEGYQMMIQHHLDTFEMDAWSVMATQASWLCDEYGWVLDEDSETFAFLCQTMLRARLQCYKDELRRLEGKMSPDPDADPLFGPKPPKRLSAPRNLGDLIDKFNAARGHGWSASTRKNYIIITRVLEEICSRDTPVEDVDSDFCRKVCMLLTQLPANYQKLPSTRGRTISDAIQIAVANGLPTISPATVNSHLNKLGAIVRFGRDEGWIVGNPMSGVEVDDPIHPSDKRDPFSTTHLRAIFATEPWDTAAPPPSAPYPSRYWTPLIALFSGARLTDICGQRVDEMIEEDGVRLFNFVHRPGDRHIKGRRSRKVPVHPELIALGFWDYVEDARRAGQSNLFADVKRDRLGKWGDNTSKWFSRKIKMLALSGRKLSFHSFRHSFEDALRRADLHDTPIGNAITGRSSPGVSKNYGSKYPARQLQEALEKVAYPDFVFTSGSGVEE